ncbi:RNA polymerase II C-terminal domain phosphatase-like 4 [Castanea sativa]|uniref:RNA polymerase II C-terminal domain phosphatase-like 4 n=1 Tax=Castanea sativa TaxID=21020 RepID=UPI003F650E8A
MKLRLRLRSKPEDGLESEHLGTDSDSHQQNIKRRKLDEYRNNVIKLERDWKTHHLLRNKKLILVLDLDLTLMESTRSKKFSSEEKYLLEEAEVVEVAKFLKAANDMFEMHIYTNANRFYALRVARLLDPDGDYFASRIITRDERPGCEKKSLDEVVGHENMVLIVDDNRDMWPNHQENLINIHAYRYFSSRSTKDDNYKSFAERKIDENEANGMLARILEGLQRVYRQFLHPELEVNLAHGDARLIFKMIRLKVLAGCVLFFSTSWFMGYPPEEVPFWIMAKELRSNVQLGTWSSSNTYGDVGHGNEGG